MQKTGESERRMAIEMSYTVCVRHDLKYAFHSDWLLALTFRCKCSANPFPIKQNRFTTRFRLSMDCRRRRCLLWPTARFLVLIKRQTSSESEPIIFKTYLCVWANECVWQLNSKNCARILIYSHLRGWAGDRWAAFAAASHFHLCGRTQIWNASRSIQRTDAHILCHSKSHQEQTWWCLIMCNCVLCRVRPSYYIWHCLRVCGRCVPPPSRRRWLK